MLCYFCVEILELFIEAMIRYIMFKKKTLFIHITARLISAPLSAYMRQIVRYLGESGTGQEMEKFHVHRE